ncbi:Os08g0263300 [Oryza sativa Japonica Group]|uniref:Os08g0263300 protein n=2 Tax=Oryza sativa subsp. japonica TaxID=39947 RepID=Q6YTB2_ORYSJ|nr:hypothetical protein DAI22_08g092800 [Oryza sativa Japonica Group]BAC99863.1 unknown protein [Oryza sativa Japonica Group]BAC99945.1 unknown protein [Oryza sativa Japonica Group]BAG97424.1 unnamed protein product [Oryza sativa Japonica Group]BAT04609.1 Os08g0263300 [Oryza sativa Japonica Group]
MTVVLRPDPLAAGVPRLAPHGSTGGERPSPGPARIHRRRGEESSVLNRFSSAAVAPAGFVVRMTVGSLPSFLPQRRLHIREAGDASRLRGSAVGGPGAHGSSHGAASHAGHPHLLLLPQ